MINSALKIKEISNLKFGKLKKRNPTQCLEEIADNEVAETILDIDRGRTALLNGLYRLEINLPEEQREILRIASANIDNVICSLVKQRKEMMKQYAKDHCRIISYRRMQLNAANEA